MSTSIDRLVETLISTVIPVVAGVSHGFLDGQGTAVPSNVAGIATMGPAALGGAQGALLGFDEGLELFNTNKHYFLPVIGNKVGGVVSGAVLGVVAVGAVTAGSYWIGYGCGKFSTYF